MLASHSLGMFFVAEGGIRICTRKDRTEMLNILGTRLVFRECMCVTVAAKEPWKNNYGPESENWFLTR